MRISTSEVILDERYDSHFDEDDIYLQYDYDAYRKEAPSWSKYDQY